MKKEMRKVFAEAISNLGKLFEEKKICTIMIGGTLHVYSKEMRSVIEERIKRALDEGKSVKENGITKWKRFMAVINPGREGSARYIWDKSGNKVKAEVFLYTKVRENNPTRESVGFKYISWDEV